MTISAVWVWLIAALVLGGSEILTGTFYLLVLAVSCLAGAVAAGLALGAAWQFSACAVLAVAGCGLVHQWRRGRSDEASDRLQNPDVGQRVTIKMEADGTAEAAYRGSTWRAVTEDGTKLMDGEAVIVRVDGARLVVRPVF